MMGSSGSGKTTLLSCLVGINHLDSGSIELFGQPMNKIRKTRLGYMPQEIALISGFTVREMVYFFGNIAGLKHDKIRERFKFLSMLLELPDKDRLTRDCSGGQQRRISFAVALVHEPEILVLDEPTVGLDPLLREKIWDYLVEISRGQNVTVLLTTHYIEEAGQATCIGLMRNGVQVAEDSPSNILQTWGTSNLEEAFLKMSERQEAGLVTPHISDVLEVVEIDSKEMSQNDSDSSGGQSNAKILQALLTKHFLEIVRHFGLVLVEIQCLIPAASKFKCL
jgi:ABC-type multidrug transport system ATPase subunit